MKAHDQIIQQLEATCGCTSAARTAAAAMRQLLDEHTQLVEWSKLAYRGLDDCYRVLLTVQGDDAYEDDKLAELRKRVQDLAIQGLALNGVGGYNYNAMRVLTGGEA